MKAIKRARRGLDLGNKYTLSQTITNLERHAHRVEQMQKGIHANPSRQIKLMAQFLRSIEMLSISENRWVVVCPDGVVRDANRGGMEDGSWYDKRAAISVAKKHDKDGPACCRLPGTHTVKPAD